MTIPLRLAPALRSHIDIPPINQGSNKPGHRSSNLCNQCVQIFDPIQLRLQPEPMAIPMIFTKHRGLHLLDALLPQTNRQPNYPLSTAPTFDTQLRLHRHGKATAILHPCTSFVYDSHNKTWYLNVSTRLCSLSSPVNPSYLQQFAGSTDLSGSCNTFIFTFLCCYLKGFFFLYAVLSNKNNVEINPFESKMGLLLVISHRLKVDLWVMAVKGYFVLPRIAASPPHAIFCNTHNTPFWKYSRRIQTSDNRTKSNLNKWLYNHIRKIKCINKLKKEKKLASSVFCFSFLHFRRTVMVLSKSID